MRNSSIGEKDYYSGVGTHNWILKELINIVSLLDEKNRLTHNKQSRRNFGPKFINYISDEEQT